MAEEVETKNVADFMPDEANANLGTPRGMAMLEESLRKYGAGRSVVLDKEGRIIAGNKTFEKAGELGINEVLVIKTDGTKLVAVQRMDLDLAKDPRARELAFADNRVGEVDLQWDVEQLVEDAARDDIDLSAFFFDWEIEQLTIPDDEEQPDGEYGGLLPPNAESAMAKRTIFVHFETEDEVPAFAELLGQEITDKTKYVWYPAKKKENLKDYEATG